MENQLSSTLLITQKSQNCLIKYIYLQIVIKFLNYLKKRKISPDFKRLKKYAGDNIGLQDTLRFVVNEYKKRKILFKEIWLLYACAPLITHKDLISASRKFQKTKKNYPMMSVTEFNIPIEWAFRKK